MKILASLMIGVTLFATSAFTSRYNTDLNKGPLNVFRRDALKCGRGWSFPGLIWGDRPVSVCMIKTNKRNVFGGEF